MRVCLRLVLIAAICSLTFGASAQDAVRVLLLTKSSGFEHGSIKERDGKQGHVQKVLSGLAEEAGVELTSTKDASLINAENLANYNLVIFYTTGDLTKEGGDGNPPMSESGVKDLRDWIRNGGGFMGYHSATDTFGHHKPDDSLPYISMLGGEFKHHGQQFVGTLKVVDSSHPTMTSLPDGFALKDEWYMFKNLDTKRMHVLALLDPGEQRHNAAQRGAYNVSNYPVIWCKEFGDGRVYYNAMGHREDVWDDSTFQLSVIEAAQWAMGGGELQADPNYDEVVPK